MNTSEIISDARETRASLRAGYMLLRASSTDTETRAALIDALERSHEAYVNRCEQFMLIVAEADADSQIASPTPLRLVKTEDAS